MKDDLITQVEHCVRMEQKWSDGIPQIAAGLFMILMMSMMLGGRSNLFVVFIPIIPIVIEGLRRRFTYPRVGRAVLRETSSRRLLFIWIIAAYLIAGIVVMLITKQQNPQQDSNPYLWFWFVPITAIVLVAVMLYRSWREHNKRIIWYALFIILLATYVIVFRPRRYTVGYIVTGFGALNLVYGVISLIRFTRKYPVMTDAQ